VLLAPLRRVRFAAPSGADRRGRAALCVPWGCALGGARAPYGARLAAGVPVR